MPKALQLVWLCLQCLMSLVMLCSSDVFELINYFSLILWLSVAACIMGLLYLRYSKPHIPRPIRVHLALPISFLICCIFLICIPAMVEPVNTGKDTYIDSVREMKVYHVYGQLNYTEYMWLLTQQTNTNLNIASVSCCYTSHVFQTPTPTSYPWKSMCLSLSSERRCHLLG